MFIGGAVTKGVRLAQIYIMTTSAAALGWPGKWNGICLSLIFLPSHSHFLSLVPSLLHAFNNRPIIHTHFFPSLSRPWLLKNLVLERRHWHGLPDGEPHTHTHTHTHTHWPTTTGNGGQTVSVCPLEKRITNAVFKHRWRGMSKTVRIAEQ